MLRALASNVLGLGVVAVLAASLALAACDGGDPASAPAATTPAATADPTRAAPAATATPTPAAPAATATPTRVPAAQETATPPPSPSAGATAVAAPGVAELGFALDRHSIWRDVYDTRTDAELACVHRELGDGASDFLAQAIFRDEPTQDWEVSMFSCLAPQTARAVLLDGLVLAAAEDGVELGDTELACAREQIAAVDVTALVAADLDDAAGDEALYTAIAGCLGHLLVELMIVDFGLDPDELSAQETACLRALGERTDWALLVAAYDATAAGDLMAGLFGCVPDLLVAVVAEQMGMELGDLSEEGLACLREWAAGVDTESFLNALTTGSLSALEELATGLASCEAVLGSAPAR